MLEAEMLRSALSEVLPSIQTAAQAWAFARSRSFLCVAVFVLHLGFAKECEAQSTTTTLVVASGGRAVTTVASGAVVTLTATVKAGVATVTTGQISFCDAMASYCTDIHLLATSQLTAAGTATYKFAPGVGSHSYRAVFRGTKINTGSASSAAALAVTGSHTTATKIAQSGAAGNYTLMATTVGNSSAAALAPTGSISFLDTTNGDGSLGVQALGAATPSFSLISSAPYTLSQEPTSVVTADFNGDGKVDIAIGQYGGNASNLAVFLGNGDGTFTAGPLGPTLLGNNPIIASGDFNGDGKPDLVLTDNSSETLDILLGNGDGTFTATASPATGPGAATGIAVGDLNGDGIADIVVANSENNLTVLLGVGDGTFYAAATPTFGTLIASPTSVTIGDFNEDGSPDLAVANCCATGSGYTSGISILLGKGDGTFQAPTIVTQSSQLTQVYVRTVDLNGDGHTDLATVDGGANIVVFLGDGSGGFTAARSAQSDSGGGSFVVGDFNGDGKPDLALADEFASTVTVLFGNGNGTFTASATGATDQYPVFPASADFNGDGIADLVTPNLIHTLSILVSAPTQTATATLRGVSPVGGGVHLVEASYPGSGSYAASVSSSTALTGLVEVTPTITWVTPSAITTATPLSATQLDATAADANGNAVPGTFVYTPAAGTLLAEGTQTLTVVFTPTNSAAFTTATRMVSIVVTQSGLTLNPAALQFGNVAYGTTSAALVVTLTNPGSATIQISSVLSELGVNLQDFGVTNNCPAALLSNTSCQVSVTFTPDGVGAKSAAVQIDDDSTPSMQTFNVAGTGTGGILQVNPGNLKMIAGTGVAGYTGDGAAAIASQLNLPDGIGFDPLGNLYIADTGNSVVRKVDTTGRITTFAGTGIAGYTGDGAAATAAELNFPYGVTSDAAGNIYIQDTHNYVIRKVDTMGKITTFAGTGVKGHTGDGGSATSAEFSDTQGARFDAAGNLYLADCEASSIRKISTEGVVTTVAGNFIAGYAGDGGHATSAELSCPSGVTFDSTGNLYIADEYNNVIREVDATGKISTFAGTGIAGATGDGGAASAAELNLPNDIVVDALGNFYIADQGNNRIRKIDTSGIITTAAGGLNSAGSPGVDSPESVTVDAAGNMYFSDSGNNKIEEVLPTGLTPFPSTPVGTTAAALMVTLSNVGNVAFAIAGSSSFTLGGNATDFALTGGTCLAGPTLRASGSATGNTCTLQISFTPTAVGQRTLTVSIADSALNTPQSFSIGGTATQGTPVVQWNASVGSIPYGATLSSQQLDATATYSNGNTLPGTFLYSPAAGTLLAAGTHTLNVNFTPTDTTDYTTASRSISIMVSRATPNLSWATPAAITMATALNSTQLDATATGISGAALQGTFVYTPAAGTLLAAGTHTLSATFTPTDTTDFTTATKMVQIVVTPATMPVITWPTPAAFVYGTALGTSQLDATVAAGGTAIPGTLVYTPAAGTVLAVGTHTLSVTFTPASTSYSVATATVTSTVTQATPTLTWTAPTPITAGTPLSATQLDASAKGVSGAALQGTFVYTPAAGTVLAAGTDTLSVAFTPADATDYTGATTRVNIEVEGLGLSGISPVGAVLGSTNTTITLTGTGFVTTSMALAGNNNLATTYVNPTTLMAVIPATLLGATGTFPITVTDPSIGAVSAAQTFTVLPAVTGATLTGPATTAPGTQPSVGLTITNPYPLALTAQFTLTFASAGSTPVDDPAIQFSTGGRTYSYTVAANSASVPPVQLQAGTDAGTITITVKLTADGADVTPADLTPLVILVPPVVPVISGTTVTASGNTLTVVIHGFSNTREVSSAVFDFTAETGNTLATPTLTLQATTIFSTWYSDATSDAYGATFTYTQIFNTNGDASTVGAVKVTLTNSVGISAASTSHVAISGLKSHVD